MTNKVNASITAMPIMMSPGSILATVFITIAIIPRDIDILSIIFPTPIASPEYLEMPPIMAKNTTSPAATPAMSNSPCFAFSGSISPIIFTAAAKASKVSPMDSIDCCIPLTSRVLVFAFN